MPTVQKMQADLDLFISVHGRNPKMLMNMLNGVNMSKPIHKQQILAETHFKI